MDVARALLLTFAPELDAAIGACSDEKVVQDNNARDECGVALKLPLGLETIVDSQIAFMALKHNLVTECVATRTYRSCCSIDGIDVPVPTAHIHGIQVDKHAADSANTLPQKLTLARLDTFDDLACLGPCRLLLLIHNQLHVHPTAPPDDAGTPALPGAQVNKGTAVRL